MAPYRYAAGGISNKPVTPASRAQRLVEQLAAKKDQLLSVSPKRKEGTATIDHPNAQQQAAPTNLNSHSNQENNNNQ